MLDPAATDSGTGRLGTLAEERQQGQESFAGDLPAGRPRPVARPTPRGAGAARPPGSEGVDQLSTVGRTTASHGPPSEHARQREWWGGDGPGCPARGAAAV